MGQYHLTVNLDKREFISPHKLGAGLKLWEQLANDIGPGKALVVLLAHPDPRGGGDFDVDENWHGPERTDMTRVGAMPEEYPAIAKRTIGRWRGDRIAIVGDYAEDSDIPGYIGVPLSSIYNLCHGDEEDAAPESVFKDVTEDVRRVIEHELNGRFIGDGWSRWVQEGAVVHRWVKGLNAKQEEGKILVIGADDFEVQWPGKKQRYAFYGKHDFF